VTKSSEATAVGASETFEEFYEREFPAVVGLAYALSGNRSGGRGHRPGAIPLCPPWLGSVGTYADRTSGCVEWSPTSRSLCSGRHFARPRLAENDFRRTFASSPL
jgi:hypothetical protein